MRRTKFTDQDFAAIYSSATSLGDVVQSTGYAPAYIIQRAAALNLSLSEHATDQQHFVRLMDAYCQMSPDWRRRAWLALNTLHDVQSSVELASDGDSA